MLLYEGQEFDMLDLSQGDDFLSEDAELFIFEALVEDVGIENFTEEELTSLVESGMLSERSIVRLDKNAHKSRAIKKAALMMAKDKNDKLYKDLKKTYMIKKKLISKIMKKYGSKATSIVRKNVYSNKGVVKKGNGSAASVSAIKKIASTATGKNGAVRTTDIKK